MEYNLNYRKEVNKMKVGFIGWLATILVIIGALNWGLVGLFSFDLVNAIFGAGTLATIIYVLVGLSGLWMIFLATKMGN
jgi:uncharacterized membrane protein YuzA (DUF378 family)